jgi:hypothetical protein
MAKMFFLLVVITVVAVCITIAPATAEIITPNIIDGTPSFYWTPPGDDGNGHTWFGGCGYTSNNTYAEAGLGDSNPEYINGYAEASTVISKQITYTADGVREYSNHVLGQWYYNDVGEGACNISRYNEIELQISPGNSAITSCAIPLNGPMNDYDVNANFDVVTGPYLYPAGTVQFDVFAESFVSAMAASYMCAYNGQNCTIIENIYAEAVDP